MGANGKRDFTQGVTFSEIPDGSPVTGSVGDEDAILIRRADNLFAVGAYCSHYHGALADGLLVGDTVRCPLHHACFDLRTGKALRTPAFDPITCWRVERIAETVFVREKLTLPAVPRIDPSGLPRSVVIVGGGAAGLSAANTLRQEGYAGPVTVLSADDSPPVDRPNLSKDFLAGTAPDEWMPLRAPEYYAEQRIELSLNSHVSAIDSAARRVSQHCDVSINYVGHAQQWDTAEVDGSLSARDCKVTYKGGERIRAVATISRDLQSLQAELAMERH